MDFTIDDTTGGDREDALVGMSFHVPKEVEGYMPPEDDEEMPSTTVSTLAFPQPRLFLGTWRANPSEFQ